MKSQLRWRVAALVSVSALGFGGLFAACGEANGPEQQDVQAVDDRFDAVKLAKELKAAWARGAVYEFRTLLFDEHRRVHGATTAQVGAAAVSVIREGKDGFEGLESLVLFYIDTLVEKRDFDQLSLVRAAFDSVGGVRFASAERRFAQPLLRVGTGLIPSTTENVARALLGTASKMGPADYQNSGCSAPNTTPSSEPSAGGELGNNNERGSSTNPDAYAAWLSSSDTQAKICGELDGASTVGLQLRDSSYCTSGPGKKCGQEISTGMNAITLDACLDYGFEEQSPGASDIQKQMRECAASVARELEHDGFELSDGSAPSNTNNNSNTNSNNNNSNTNSNNSNTNNNSNSNNNNTNSNTTNNTNNDSNNSNANSNNNNNSPNKIIVIVNNNGNGSNTNNGNANNGNNNNNSNNNNGNNNGNNNDNTNGNAENDGEESGDGTAGGNGGGSGDKPPEEGIRVSFKFDFDVRFTVKGVVKGVIEAVKEVITKGKKDGADIYVSETAECQKLEQMIAQAAGKLAMEPTERRHDPRTAYPPPDQADAAADAMKGFEACGLDNESQSEPGVCGLVSCASGFVAKGNDNANCCQPALSDTDYVRMINADQMICETVARCGDDEANCCAPDASSGNAGPNVAPRRPVPVLSRFFLDASDSRRIMADGEANLFLFLTEETLLSN